MPHCMCSQYCLLHCLLTRRSGPPAEQPGSLLTSCVLARWALQTIWWATGVPAVNVIAHAAAVLVFNAKASKCSCSLAPATWHLHCLAALKALLPLALQAISQSFHTVVVEGVPAMDMQVCI